MPKHVTGAKSMAAWELDPADFPFPVTDGATLLADYTYWAQGATPDVIAAFGDPLDYELIDYVGPDRTCIKAVNAGNYQAWMQYGGSGSATDTLLVPCILIDSNPGFSFQECLGPVNRQVDEGGTTMTARTWQTPALYLDGDDEFSFAVLATYTGTFALDTFVVGVTRLA